MNINIEKDTESKINNICLLFSKETGEKLSPEDCVKLSVETLKEEVENYGAGRMFLRTSLWKKGSIYLNGKDGIIESH